MAELAMNIFRKRLAAGDNAFSTASTFFLMLVSTEWLDQSDLEDFDVIGTTTTADFTTGHPIHYEPSTTSGYERQKLSTAWDVQQINASNRADIDNANITFSSVSSGAGIIGAAIMVLERAANDSSGTELVGSYDTGFPVTPNGGDLTVQWSTGGTNQLTS